MSNREIKFRAWNGEKMITQFDGIANIDTFNTSPKKQLLVCIGGYSWGTANWGTNVILEQYTGLKDRYGIEIYEGDILNVKWVVESKGGYLQSSDAYCEKNEKVEVCWYNQGFAYRILKGNLISLNRNATIEIIGNIHQNPELL